MSYNNRSIMFLFIFSSFPVVGAASEVHCARTFDGLPIDGLEVFNGPPSKMVSLMGSRGMWGVGKDDGTPGEFYLRCTYRDGSGREANVDHRIPAEITKCYAVGWYDVVCK